MTADRPVIIQDGSDVLLAVRVQPRASRNQLVVAGTQPGGLGAQRAARDADMGPVSFTLRVTASPVGGDANAACRAFLADLLGIAQSRLLIVRGKTSRNKLLRVRDANVASILARLQPQK